MALDGLEGVIASVARAQLARESFSREAVDVYVFVPTADSIDECIADGLVADLMGRSGERRSAMRR